MTDQQAQDLAAAIDRLTAAVEGARDAILSTDPNGHGPAAEAARIRLGALVELPE